MGTKEFQFHPGLSYRHLMVWRDGARRYLDLEKAELTPPHDIIGREISPFFPQMKEPVLSLVKQSQGLLKDHPVNRVREAKGLPPANSIWLWGQGRPPRMPKFREIYGVKGLLLLQLT
jgi:2,3-bisphosphoglycerate-independent phosphoglycerate mutase